MLGFLRGGFLAALVLSAMPPSLAAQDSLPLIPVAPPRIKPALGASVDRFMYDGYGITAVSFHYSRLKPNKASTELAAAVFPDALAAGSLLLATDLGAGYDARGNGFDLLLKAGLSALTALGRGGFLAQPGYHFGSGLLIRTGKASGVRLDVVRHAYLIEQETEVFWSVGIGFTTLPVRRPQARLPDALRTVP